MIRFYRIFQYIIELVLLPILGLIAILSRFLKKSIDIGIGPEPLINNVYHKQALELYGYRAQTFITRPYFITDKFDVRTDSKLIGRNRYPFKGLIQQLYLWLISVLRYKCLYIYFNGGPLGSGSHLLKRIEPLLYKLAGIKVVVMPYGSDVQDMSRSPNLLFKHAQTRDYPSHRFRRQAISIQIDRWTKYADHVISGCEWVDYMYHWDTLMLAHFSIDVDMWQPARSGCAESETKLRVLHAPNHREIKGSRYFMNAINELIEEGVNVELVILERVPNEKVRDIMATVDVVADQLVIGWYAMFALEAMAMEKAVLCYLRDDLKTLYINAGLVMSDEIPIVCCTPLTVKEVIRDLALNKAKLTQLGKRSREYVVKHHSTQAVGKIFDKVNRSIGIKPSRIDE